MVKDGRKWRENRVKATNLHTFPHFVEDGALREPSCPRKHVEEKHSGNSRRVPNDAEEDGKHRGKKAAETADVFLMMPKTITSRMEPSENQHSVDGYRVERTEHSELFWFFGHIFQAFKWLIKKI